jgi:hypothetical protein
MSAAGQQLSLQTIWAKSGVAEMGHQELLNFLGGSEQMKPLVHAIAADNSLSGASLLVEFSEWSIQFPEAFKFLRVREMADTTATSTVDLPPKKRTFSTNTYINKSSGHFYIERLFAVKLATKMKEDPGIYLIHGPRSSGKSTLLGQVLRFLLADPDSYVFAVVDVLGVSATQSENIDMWMMKMMTGVSNENSMASPLVRQAAARYLQKPGMISNGLQFLFNQDYSSRKLVLIFDEFDTVYDKPFAEGLAALLRNIKNELPHESLQSFQSVVCCGAYNASRVTGAFNSPFVEDSVFGYDHFDFTFNEVCALFRQYMSEYGVTVDCDVIERIHSLTGGHTGLVNACGYELQKQRLHHVTMDAWNELLPSVITAVTSRKVFVAIMEALRIHPRQTDVQKLLTRLCYGDGICYYRRDDLSQCLLHLGLAKVQYRGAGGDSVSIPVEGLSQTKNSVSPQETVFGVSGLASALPATEWLIIKSELMRQCALLYIMADTDLFPTALPMEADGKLSISSFLKTAFQFFVPAVIQSAYQYSYKKHGVRSNEVVPTEAVYQHQLSAVIIRALRYRLWYCLFETNADGKKLDFLLCGPNGLKVGIELTASVDVTGLEEHARRTYPSLLALDQYVVVNITSIFTEDVFAVYASDGTDKHGRPCKVPVYHVLHNADYSKVSLHIGPQDTIDVISGC